MRGKIYFKCVDDWCSVFWGGGEVGEAASFAIRAIRTLDVALVPPPKDWCEPCMLGCRRPVLGEPAGLSCAGNLLEELCLIHTSNASVLFAVLNMFRMQEFYSPGLEKTHGCFITTQRMCNKRCRLAGVAHGSRKKK